MPVASQLKGLFNCLVASSTRWPFLTLVLFYSHGLYLCNPSSSLFPDSCSGTHLIWMLGGSVTCVQVIARLAGRKPHIVLHNLNLGAWVKGGLKSGRRCISMNCCVRSSFVIKKYSMTKNYERLRNAWTGMCYPKLVRCLSFSVVYSVTCTLPSYLITGLVTATLKFVFLYMIWDIRRMT